MKRTLFSLWFLLLIPRHIYTAECTFFLGSAASIVGLSFVPEVFKRIKKSYAFLHYKQDLNKWKSLFLERFEKCTSDSFILPSYPHEEYEDYNDDARKLLYETMLIAIKNNNPKECLELFTFATPKELSLPYTANNTLLHILELLPVYQESQWNLAHKLIFEKLLQRAPTLITEKNDYALTPLELHVAIRDSGEKPSFQDTITLAKPPVECLVKAHWAKLLIRKKCFNKTHDIMLEEIV